MRIDACPHCGKNRIITTDVPRDVVVVVPCPECKEFVVLFRDKTAGLSRRILEHGTREERTAHLAEVIEAFIEPGMFSGDDAASRIEGAEVSPPGEDADDDADAGDAESAYEAEPITQDEVDRFVRIDLKRIDNARYFRRHFG